MPATGGVSTLRGVAAMVAARVGVGEAAPVGVGEAVPVGVGEAPGVGERVTPVGVNTGAAGGGGEARQRLQGAPPLPVGIKLQQLLSIEAQVVGVFPKKGSNVDGVRQPG